MVGGFLTNKPTRDVWQTPFILPGENNHSKGWPLGLLPEFPSMGEKREQVRS